MPSRCFQNHTETFSEHGRWHIFELREEEIPRDWPHVESQALPRGEYSRCHYPRSPPSLTGCTRLGRAWGVSHGWKKSCILEKTTYLLSSYRRNKRVWERERHSTNLGLNLGRLSARALEDMSASDHWSTTQNSLQPGSYLQCLLPFPAAHLSSVRNCRARKQVTPLPTQLDFISKP